MNGFIVLKILSFENDLSSLYDENGHNWYNRFENLREAKEIEQSKTIFTMEFKRSYTKKPDRDVANVYVFLPRKGWKSAAVPYDALHITRYRTSRADHG